MQNQDFVIKDGAIMENGYTGKGGDVIIPEGVERIKRRAFTLGTFKDKITNLFIPESVTDIDPQPFLNCEPDSITISEGSSFSYENGILYDNDKKKVVYVHSGMKTISFKNNVHEIGDKAFYGSHNITEITFPEGLKRIGNENIWATEDLRVNLPASIEEFGHNAFQAFSRIVFSIDSAEHWNGIHRDAFEFKWKLLINGEEVPTIVIDGNAGSIRDNAFNKCTNLKNVIIGEGVTSIGINAFSECLALEKIDISESVKSIGKGAFSKCVNLTTIKLPTRLTQINDQLFYYCTSLKDINIPENVEIIGSNAFSSCAITNIRIPKNLQLFGSEVFHHKSDFDLRDYDTDSRLVNIDVDPANEKYFSVNGSLVERDGENNILICVPEGTSCDEYVIPNEVNTIKEDALLGTTFKKTYFHKNFVPISIMFDKMYLWGTPIIDCEKGFLCRSMKFPTFCTAGINDPESCAYAVVFQTGKTWDVAIAQYIDSTQDFKYILKNLSSLIENNPKESIIKKVVSFVLHFIDKADSTSLKEFYTVLYRLKSKNLKLLLEDNQVQKLLLNGQLTSEKQEKKENAENSVETMVQEHWKASEITRKLKSIISEGIPYINSEGISSPEAVILIIAIYAGQMDRYPKNYSEYKTSFVHAKPTEIADKVAKGLDICSLQNLLEELAFNDEYQKEGYLLAFGRYASPKQISKLTARMTEWENWGRYGGLGRKRIIIARGALMLSDTREAMMAIDKANVLDYYASIRNTDADTIRDTVLADFGFDNNGKKIYDLGGNTASISMNKDLSLSIFDNNSGKIVKSIPKKGSDDSLYESAKNDFSDLKKNIKRVVTNRRKLLFKAFLSAQSFNVERWKKSYLENPVLNAVAGLIVWKQGDDYFIPTEDGKTISCNGEEFLLDSALPILIAHPKEMTAAEIISWQQYFLTHNLKQPFEQIWEPVYKEEDIKTDRYKGCSVSVYRFTGKEEHGISAWGLDDYSEEFGVDLIDCELKVESDTWRFVHGVTDDAKFTLRSFRIKNFTRYANHIIYMFDKWTIEDRILNNDPTIRDVLNSFTLAQILKFISLASEKNSTDSLAVLMEYKNSKYSEYDPMMELILD